MPAALPYMCALLSVLLTLPMASAYGAEAQGYPLQLQNCGKSITINHPPERAVSLGQNTTEILLSLGLEDHLVGTGVWISEVPDALATANAQVTRLSDGIPGFESVLGQNPDLVAAQFESDVGEHGRVARREQFEALGIPTYLSPTDCVARVRGEATNSDGARTRLFSTDLLYREIRELAAIFDVPDRGQALVAQLRARETRATEQARQGLPEDLSMVWWFSSAEISGDAWVAGSNGAPGYIMSRIGARNIIETDEEWPAVSWERIAIADPDVIVLGEMARRNFPADDVAKKIAFLENDPVTQQMSAVKKHRYIVLDAQSMNPTLRTIEGLEQVAEGLSALGLSGPRTSAHQHMPVVRYMSTDQHMPTAPSRSS